MRLVPILRPTARLAAVALVLVASGCEDDVDPTLGTDQVFSLYGYLDPTADRQALRVVPVVGTVGADSARTLDATVTSVELGSGREIAWRDSVVTYADGVVGHVFVADYTPPPGERVEIRVESPRGGVTAEVILPPLARARLDSVSTANGAATYLVRVPDVPRLVAGRLTAFVTGMPGAPADTSALVLSDYRPEFTRDGADWTVAVPFVEAARQHLDQTGLRAAGLRLVEVEFAPFVASDGWDVGGFDDDALVEPGTFSNVAGGFGYVGAGYWAPVRWLPSVSSQARAGFAVDTDPAAVVRINEVGAGFVELYNRSVEPVYLEGYILSLGEASEGTRIIGSGVVPGRGFYATQVPFSAIHAGDVVRLYSSGGQFITQLAVEVSVGATPFGLRSFGAYPDGYSYILSRNQPFPIPIPFPRATGTIDLFTGPNRPTPGAPNEPAFVPVRINEVYAAGSDGWVEALVTEPSVAETLVLLIGSSVSEILWTPPLSPPGPFAVADEGYGLDLPQGGGEVFLFAKFGDPDRPDLPADYRIVDHRFYAPQETSRSAGRLPDGPDSTWLDRLLPTRGAPNSDGARHAARQPLVSAIVPGPTRRPSSVPRP